ncbi:MAG: hypothetical protein JWR19_47 [Pedosphaera sp.]|nr:hypothetical protein [Pedosphaera sp.]
MSASVFRHEGTRTALTVRVALKHEVEPFNARLAVLANHPPEHSLPDQLLAIITVS